MNKKKDSKPVILGKAKNPLRITTSIRPYPKGFFVGLRPSSE